MYHEKCTKHDAILNKQQNFIGNRIYHSPCPSQTPKPEKPETNPTEWAALLNKMFTYFKNAVYNSKPTQHTYRGENSIITSRNRLKTPASSTTGTQRRNLNKTVFTAWFINRQ
jgi:hypothetical protein